MADLTSILGLSEVAVIVSIAFPDPEVGVTFSQPASSLRVQLTLEVSVRLLLAPDEEASSREEGEMDNCGWGDWLTVTC